MTSTFEAVGNSIHDSAHNHIFQTGQTEQESIKASRNRDAVLTSYSSLSLQKKQSIRIASIDKLLLRSFLGELFSCHRLTEPTGKTASPSYFRLAEYLQARGTRTVGIFRREGNRQIYRRIADDMIRFDQSSHNRALLFDFSRYPILELASALKYYVREVMDGLFEYRLMPHIFAAITCNNREQALLYCRYLLMALSQPQREFFILLKGMLWRIVETKESNRMDWESICNIFSLTVCPLEAFKSVQFIPVAVEFFHCIMEIDPENLKGLF